MTDRTIDLRKNRSLARLPDPRRREMAIEWSAEEYEKRDRGPYWLPMLVGAAILLAAFGVFTQSYFFAAFVALALFTWIMYEKKGPAEVSFAVSSEGVRAGKNFFNFSELKSFWIFSSANPQELSLETDKTLNPFIRLSLKNTDPERIRAFLLNFLPEEEHKELISDQIERNL